MLALTLTDTRSFPVYKVLDIYYSKRSFELANAHLLDLTEWETSAD